ncbi:MAG: hypothetical protein LBH01_05105 [Verrucomicrobiales bacterium]|jgi:hypothetical protein|nr:hypothetical protein [Verrucomicrobiales bacterium]
MKKKLPIINILISVFGMVPPIVLWLIATRHDSYAFTVAMILTFVWACLPSYILITASWIVRKSVLSSQIILISSILSTLFNCISYPVVLFSSHSSSNCGEALIGFPFFQVIAVFTMSIVSLLYIKPIYPDMI